MSEEIFETKGFKFRIRKMKVRQARGLVIILTKYLGKMLDKEEAGFSEVLEALTEADLDTFEKRFRACSEVYMDDQWYNLDVEQVYAATLDTDLGVYWDWLFACGRVNFADFLAEKLQGLQGANLSGSQSTSKAQSSKSPTRLSRVASRKS